MPDFLSFQTLLTPKLIRFIFWFSLVVILLRGLAMLFETFWGALALLILGPPVVRVLCELALVIFHAHARDVPDANISSDPPTV